MTMASGMHQPIAPKSHTYTMTETTLAKVLLMDIAFKYLTVRGVEPAVMHQISWHLESTGECGVQQNQAGETCAHTLC